LADRALSQTLDWGKLAPLRLTAESVAEGIYTGIHRSTRRGAGVEFGGHRDYVPGDDLRWLDHRAMLRHDRLLVREFETETDRALRVVIDTTASMAYRSTGAPGAKLAYAAVVAAALCRVALAAGDPVAIDWLGSRESPPLPSMGGREAFNRVLGALEHLEPNPAEALDAAAVDRCLAPVSKRARRGTIVLVLSDFLDLPEGTFERIGALCTGGRIVIATRILDPAEATFPFSGPLRLRASESGLVRESDAATARAGYLEALGRQEQALEASLVPRGGRYLRALTSEAPVEVVRAIIARARRGGA
jgi:uncharacterized protein (DUF58 family)